MTDSLIDTSDLPPPRKWPLVLALLASLLWLVALGGFGVLTLVPGLMVPPLLQSIAAGSGMALMLLAPLAIIWLIAGRLRDASGTRAARTALAAAHADFTQRKLDQAGSALTDLENRMARLAATIEAIGAPVERHQMALNDAATRLDASGARLTAVSLNTEAATVTLGTATPVAIGQAESLLALLGTAAGNLQRQLAETESLLAQLHRAGREGDAQAEAAAARTQASITAVNAAAITAENAITAPLARLVEGVDAAFLRTAQAMDATRDGVHAQIGAMLASVDQARVTLDHIGGEAARQIDARLQALLGDAQSLGAEIGVQAANANALIDDVSRGFTILDAKLNNSANTGTSTLETITQRMNEAREAIHRLGEPIAATENALSAVEDRLGTVGIAAVETFDSLNIALPAALPQLDDMAIRLSDLHERADQLSLPLDSGRNSIAEAQHQLDRARESLDAAAVQLGAELTAARNALADIDTLTGSASLAASTQLIEVFGRVRDIANQTAGTMRETLSSVVAEAEAALDQAGTSRAELAFGAPIRARLAEVEVLHERVAAAGQAAAERVTKRLLALTETVAGVEQRIDETDTRYEIRARSSLARRSSLMIESMQAATIDIAALLAFDIEDTAWDNYLKGDKSIFARRIVERLDANGTRAIARHFEHDAEFRTEATHYIEEFEALIGHVMPDREGRSLAVTLLSSNIGRLYIALGQAVGRFG
ncbi:MAG: hypothetical protein ACOYLS_05900 [Polymorphobacter sp.]